MASVLPQIAEIGQLVNADGNLQSSIPRRRRRQRYVSKEQEEQESIMRAVQSAGIVLSDQNKSQDDDFTKNRTSSGWR